MCVDFIGFHFFTAVKNPASKISLDHTKISNCCCQPPELAEAVEKEVVVYGGYEKFSGLFLFCPRRMRGARDPK
jgi:hypothetical protein